MTSALSARAAVLRRGLSDRDLAVLASLAELRLLSASQVQRLHVYMGESGTQPRRTRAVLQRLHDLHLVIRMSRVVGGIRAGSTGYIYGLSGLGQAVLNISGTYGRRRRSIWETKPYFQDHVLAVAELCVQLIEACRNSAADLMAFEAEPACWRRHTGSGGELVTLKPDAYVRVGVGDIERSSFIEVDMATESPATIHRKCQAYVTYWLVGTEQQQHGVFPSVLWLVPDHHRAQRLTEVVRRLPIGMRTIFTVALLQNGPSLLTAPEGGGN
jgi:hypothetical protein